MGHMHEKLDQRRLSDLANDPDFKAAEPEDKITAAMVHLSALLAERAVLGTATAALDVSRRAAWEAIAADAAPVRIAPIQDTLDPEYMLEQIAEARALLDAASTALCPWYGTVHPDRARMLMESAIESLADE